MVKLIVFYIIEVEVGVFQEGIRLEMFYLIECLIIILFVQEEFYLKDSRLCGIILEEN